MERKLWNSQADGFVSLVDMLAQRAEAQPNQRAYTYLVDGIVERDTLTYRQLDRQSREIAVMLQSAIDQGDRALLMYAPGLDFVSAFFGCLCAGVIAVPVYPPQSSRPERSLPGLRAIYSESGAKAILCTEEGFGKFSSLLQNDPELSKCPLLATDHYGLEDIEEWKVPEVHADSIAILQYTSGSTAAPKGVIVSHGNIVHNLAYIQNISHHESDNVLVSWLPTYHDMGLFSGVLFPLFNNCPAYLMSPTSFLQKPFRWLQAISHFRGTNSGAPDFAFELCA
jgi:acyl-CoA synthetase (AMP-forming)/AMP-acid ligase II